MGKSANNRTEKNTRIVKNNKIEFPHVFALLFIITVIMAALTWIVPAGQFDRVELGKRTMVVAGSYNAVEANPQGIMDIFKAILGGWDAAAIMIFMIFIVGGAIKIIEDTGTIRLGMKRLVSLMKGKESFAIVLVMTMMSIGGATGVFANPVVALMPMGIVLAKGLGYDEVVGFGMIYLGAYAGFNVGWANIFTVGLAHQIAELPMFSGMAVRVLFHILYLSLAAFFVMKYAKMIKKDPTKSMTYDKQGTEIEKDDNLNKDEVFGIKQKMVSLVTIISFGTIIYGSLKMGWSMNDFSVVFLIMGVASGIVGGLGMNGTANSFVKGCSGMAYAALIVGMARAISVVIQNGQIMDTLIYYISKPIVEVGPIIGANLMFLANIVINFFIPSGSGQAVTVMPIMVPIADLTGITRQVATQAFQFGDGFTNSVFPTSGTLMACLGLAKLPYDRYFKWLKWFFLIQFLFSIVSITILQLIQWGPL